MQEMPTGVVMRKKSGDEKEFVLRRCCIEDLDAIVDLQEAVYDALEEKSSQNLWSWINAFALWTRTGWLRSR